MASWDWPLEERTEQQLWDAMELLRSIFRPWSPYYQMAQVRMQDVEAELIRRREEVKAMEIELMQSCRGEDQQGCVCGARPEGESCMDVDWEAMKEQEEAQVEEDEACPADVCCMEGHD